MFYKPNNDWNLFCYFSADTKSAISAYSQCCFYTVNNHRTWDRVIVRKVEIGFNCHVESNSIIPNCFCCLKTRSYLVEIVTSNFSGLFKKYYEIVLRCLAWNFVYRYRQSNLTLWIVVIELSIHKTTKFLWFAAKQGR